MLRVVNFSLLIFAGLIGVLTPLAAEALPVVSTVNSLIVLPTAPTTPNIQLLSPNYTILINTQNYQAIHAYITTKFKAVSTENAHLISYEICKQTAETQVDPFLIASIIAVESRFNHNAVGAGRASGLGQFMPGTARVFDIKDPFDISQNVSGMGRYLQKLNQKWDKYDNSRTLVLVSYNRGERHVQLNRTKLGPKALSYPEKVMFHYKKLEEVKTSLSATKPAELSLTPTNSVN